MNPTAVTTRRTRRHPGRLRRESGGDRGSVGVELAIGAPMGVLLLFLVIGAYHLGRANVDVNAAAAAASRAASISRSVAAASAAAHDTASADLADHCQHLSVVVDTSQFHRGGTVTVHVDCTVTTHGLLDVGLPGHVTVSSSSTSPIDLYRA